MFRSELKKIVTDIHDVTSTRQKNIMKEIFITADKLSDVVKNMQKCLQCVICLHTITDPAKTICGHRFCRVCIQKVLESEKSLCPLCNNALQRRNIFTDEQMIIYIDRFQKLIHGIELDTGIVLLNTSRPNNTLENSSLDGKEHRKLDDEDVIKPSCSYAKRNAQRKQLIPRSNLKTQSERNSSGQRCRKQSNQDIKSYLSTCGFSGIGPLSPDKFSEHSNDKSANDKSADKVHGWLENLPGNEMLDDPSKLANAESTEVNLDDTLPISVSQTVANTEMEGVAKIDEIVLESVVPNNTRQSMTKQLPESSCRNENNKNESIGKKNRRESSDTRIVANYSTMMEIEDATPGPSAVTKSNDDGKEKSEDKFNDVHRTSPCDMLSTMQQNWSVVAKFGKEMRTKKKKLKTLNVSIENKRKGRPLDEPATKLDGEVKSKVTNDTEKKRRKSTESKMVEYVTKAVVHEEFMEGARERKARDRSVSEKDQRNDGSFADSLLKNEEPNDVHYFDHQIYEIIGVTGNDRRTATEKDASNNREETTNGKKRHIESSDDLDRLKRTPDKLIGCEDRQGLFEGSAGKKDDGRTTPTNENESYSASRASPILRGRLSLNRPTTDVISNGAVDSNVLSRQQVRRDLNRQMDKDERNDDVARKTQKACKIEERRSSAGDKQDDKRASNTIVASKLTTSKMEMKKDNMSLVTFKKLGKTCKFRKKLVSFLYLGTTRRKAMLDGSHLALNLQKPFNPVDILDNLDSENDRGFGNRAEITVNPSPSTDIQEIENVPAIEIAKVNDAPETKDLTNSISVQIEQDPIKDTIIHITNSDPCVLYVSVNENAESVPPCAEDPNTSNNASNDVVKMLTPTKDSQLQFLSLESPPLDTLQTQKLIHDFELAADGASKRKSTVEPNSEASREFLDCTPSKKRRRSNTRETVPRRITEDDEVSSHSFSSQATRISKDAVMAKLNSLSGTSHSSDRSTKNVDAISLSSDTMIKSNDKTDGRKVYKRIVPLASDTDSNDVVYVNHLSNDPADSSTTKRKRRVSFDSDSESGLEEILSNWYAEARPEEHSVKKGKLERARDPSNSMNASRRGDASSKACSSGRGESANKLSTQQRRNPLELAGKSVAEKSSFPRARWGKNVDGIGALVAEEDSPDFGATIDKIKDIRDKMIASGEKQGNVKEVNLMQDNLDDILASVNTDALADEYTPGKKEECKARSVGCSKFNNFERSTKQGRSGVENVSLSSDGPADTRCNGSNAVLFVSDEDDNTLVPTTVNVSNKSAKSDKFRDIIKPVKVGRNSMRGQTNKSLLPKPNIFSDYNKLSPTVNDSYVKDTYDMDSLMNITQRDMLFKQFEEDLFGKAVSNSLAEKHQKTPQKSRKSMDSLKENRKDVEHSGEEDDIVENTPETKTKNTQAITSPPGSSIASSISKITVRPFSEKSTPSTIGKNSVTHGLPGCKRNIQPLYQSTPKSYKSTMSGNNYAKRVFSPGANQSPSKQAKRDVSQRSLREYVQNVPNVSRQGLCFVCSSLLPSEIAEVKRLAEMFNARYVTQFDRDVTHVIVKASKENNGANKTLKYLQGIAHRKWIVTHEWVVSSLREGRLVNEEPYEAVDSRTLEAGPRKSRLREKGLFEGFMFLCIGPYSDVSVEQYKDLVRATGATVVDSLDALAAEKNMLKIIVIQTDIYEYEIIEWFKTARAVSIIHDWVVECISQYQLISFFPYLQELTPDDVLSLGYPEYLVEDLDSESTCDFTM